MASNFIDEDPSTSSVISLSSQPNSSSFQNSCTSLVSEIPAEGSFDVENVCPNSNVEGNVDINQRGNGWTRSLINLPAFEYAFIHEHLVENSETMPDNRPTGAHRHKKMGYRLFKENYVKNVRVKPNVQANSKLFLVKSLVCASMKQQSYTVYVHLSQTDGKVVKAKCSCKAGAGGCCKHVAATLFQIHDFVELGLSVVPDDKSCTDVLQQWNVPRNMDTHGPLLFTELKFEKANFERDNSKRKRPILSASRDGYCATPPMAREISVERITKLKDNLTGSNTLLSTLLCDSDCKPCTIFPTSLKTPVNCDENLITVDPRQEIFDGLAQEIEWKHVDGPCRRFVTDVVCVSKEEVKIIEKETMGQSSSKKWFIERQKRLTSSNFGSVIKRRMHIYPKSILKKVLGHERLSTPACHWGLENEQVAKEKYNEKLPNAKLYDCGLIINPQWPWLACSPDGLSLLNGEWYAIEIKCPFSKRDMTVEEACSDKTFCMTLIDGKPMLKKNHQYYFQCLGVMALCQLPFVHFIVYTQKEICIERINFDKQLWNKNMLPKLSDFYFKFMMPEILKA